MQRHDTFVRLTSVIAVAAVLNVTSLARAAPEHPDASVELGAAWGGSGPGYDVWVKSVLQFAAATGYSFKAVPHSNDTRTPGDTDTTVVVLRDGNGRLRYAAWYVRRWAQQGHPTAMGMRPFEQVLVGRANGGGPFDQIVMTSAEDVAQMNTYLAYIFEDFSVRIQTSGLTFQRPEGCLDSTGVWCGAAFMQPVSSDVDHQVSVTVPWPFDADAHIAYHSRALVHGGGGGWLDILGKIFVGVSLTIMGNAIGGLIFVGSEVATTTFAATFGAFMSSLVFGEDLMSAVLDGLIAGSFAYVGATVLDAFGDPTALVGVEGAGCPRGDQCWFLELLNGFPPTKALAELHDPFIDWSIEAFEQAGAGWYKAITIPPFGVSGCAASAECVTAGLIIATEREVTGPRQTIRPPTCTASISPGAGTTTTTFQATWSSANATSCTWELDGVDQGSTPCDWGVASPLPVGTHSVAVIATGPAGSTRCPSNTVVVSTPPPLPTCAASISPTSGTTATTFTASWSSNATSCSWKLDGVHQGAVACSGTVSSKLPAGVHRVTLVATGPGGTRSCDSNAVGVSAPLPTCAASISPTSGTTATTFTASWSSNATSCSWKLDGVHQGAVACSGTVSSKLPAGSHNVALVATGPGGTKSCTSNTISVSP